MQSQDAWTAELGGTCASEQQSLKKWDFLCLLIQSPISVPAKDLGSYSRVLPKFPTLKFSYNPQDHHCLVMKFFEMGSSRILVFKVELWCAEAARGQDQDLIIWLKVGMRCEVASVALNREVHNHSSLFSILALAPLMTHLILFVMPCWSWTLFHFSLFLFFWDYEFLFQSTHD